MSKVIVFRKPAVPVVQDGYVFREKPAAKSSSGVLVAQPGIPACPSCGCREPKDAAHPTAIEVKPGCTCTKCFHANH